jgi:transposase-like protein
MMAVARGQLRLLSEVGVEGASASKIAWRHDVTRPYLYQGRRELRRKPLTAIGHRVRCR